MYFYAVTGKQKVKNITETTNEEGEIVLVTTITEVDVKKVITQKQANEYVKNGTYPVYVVEDDGTEELIELYSDDDPPEELVGGLEEPAETVTATQFITVTEEIVTVPRTSTQENDYRLTYSFSPTNEGYQLLGVIGFSVMGTSNVLPFRIINESGVVNIGLKNTSTHVDSVNIKLNLLWIAVIETDNE